MMGIVLASGYGSRLAGLGGPPKYFLDIAGRPLISYPLRALRIAGADPLYVVVNRYTCGYLWRYWDGLGRPGVVLNPRPELENGYTLVMALSRLWDGSALVSVSDHIYPSYVASRVVSCMDGYDFVIAGDRSPRYVDVGEATMIRVDDEGCVEMVGKGLDRFDYIDMGVFAFSIDTIRFIKGIPPQRLGLSQLINMLVDEGFRGGVCSFEGVPWKDVDTPEDYLAIRSGDYNEVLREVLRDG